MISFRKFTFVTSLISAVQWHFYNFLVTDHIHTAAISPEFKFRVGISNVSLLGFRNVE